MRQVRQLIRDIVAAYVCRGCGTEITTPTSFRKCPVCGIRIN